MKKKRSVDLTENILYNIQQQKEFCQEEKISETCCPLLNLFPVAKLSQAPAPALLAECCFIITLEQSTQPPTHPPTHPPTR
jgi:hypothetical protein